MLIVSWCTIQLGDLVILRPSEFLEDELTPPTRTMTIQAADYFRTEYKDRIGRRLLEHSFSFTRVVRFPTCAAARYYGFNHAAELPADPADCVLAGEDGGGWLLKRAVLGHYVAKVSAYKFIATYTVTGGEWTVTDIPAAPADTESPDGAPSPPAPGDRLRDDDGAGIQDGAGNPIVVE